MATPSAPETSPITGCGAARGSGWVDVWLSGRDGLPLGGSMSLKMAREFARTILQVAGEEGSGDGG